MFVNKSNFFTPFYVARPNHVPGVCANLVHLHAPFLDIFLCARLAQTFTIAWLPLYVLPLAYPLRSLRRIFFAKPLKVFPMPVIVFTICTENVCYKVSNTCYKLCNAC